MSNLKEKIDNLFSWFENNKFTNEGNYPRSTNLVFEFDEWIRELSDISLSEYLGVSLKSAVQARKMISAGIDKWLEN